MLADRPSMAKKKIIRTRLEKGIVLVQQPTRVAGPRDRVIPQLGHRLTLAEDGAKDGDVDGGNQGTQHDQKPWFLLVPAADLDQEGRDG